VIDTSDGSARSVFIARGGAFNRNAGWRLASIDMTAWAGKTIRLRFSATDAGRNGLVEAGFDDVRVTLPQ